MIQCLIGWREIFTGKYLFVPKQYLSLYKREKWPVAMWYNVNNFSNLMFFGSASSFFLYAASSKRTHKYIFLFCFIIFSLIIFYSESRANIAGYLIMIMFVLTHNKRNIITYILLFITFSVLIPNFISLIKTSFIVDVHASGDLARINLIKNGLYYFKETLGFGVGAGQIETWVKRYSPYNTYGTINMHNWWIEVLVSYGIGIFIGYVVFYIKLFTSNYKYCFSSNNKIRVSSLILCGLMLGYSLACISSSSNITNEALWTYFAILITLRGIKKENNEEKNL